MTRAARFALLMMTTAAASACAAQDRGLDTLPPPEPVSEEVEVEAAAAAMDAIAARVPEQDWYPGEYRDIAIAARYFHEEELSEFPPLPKPTAEEIAAYRAYKKGDFPPPGGVDVINCDERDFAFDYTGTSSDTYERYGPVALDVGYVDARLMQAGYAPEHFSEPLLAFEKLRFAAFEKQSGDPDHENWDEVGTAYRNLADAIDAVRVEQNLELPPVYADGGCGAGGEPPVRIATFPARGQVWLINAFAFKVCTRKTRDPWDTEACRWNEVETGKDTYLGGRYMYKVRWPDGTIRKGARQIYAGFNEDGSPSEVTFRRTGS